MMTVAELMEIAAEHHIGVFEYPFNGITGIAVFDDGEYSIGINRAKCGSDAGYKVTLAHEVGHCFLRAMYRETDGPERKAAAERAADAWAAVHLVPSDELNQAIAGGCNQVAALAMLFDVTEEFLQKALDIYRIDSVTA